MDENLLEQKIEDLIEEKAEKIEQGEQPDSKLGELIEKKVEQKIDEEKETETVPQKTTRRNFMKMLGLGAGGLALSSAASANFFSVNKNVGSTENTLTDILSNGNDASGNSITNLGSLSVNNDISANSASVTNQVSAGSVSTTGTITAGSEIVLPDLNSDPSASTGAMWYRSDLE
jgi:hypothetical protein